MAKHWINNAVKNGKGALHRHLNVPEHEKIPAEKLAAAKHSKNPTIRREAALVHTLMGMHHHSKEHHAMTGKHIAHMLYKS